MEARSSCSRPRKSNSRVETSIQSLDADLLCTIFASLDPILLVRCSAVCKSWNGIIRASSLLKDLYHKHWGSNDSIPSVVSLKSYLEEVAIEQHRLSLLDGTAEVHQWNGHTVRSSQCRMKMGSIVTGVGDKVLRMWSSESYKCLGEYSVPDVASLVDFDFDESKIVGLVGTRICIWKPRGKRSMLPSKECTFTRGFCMRYIDPDAVIGCEDGTARIFDIYSQRCSQIIRMRSGPITCLDLTDDPLILCGSSLGNITVACLSSGQKIACLKASTAPTGITSVSFNQRNNLVFAGSTAGYSHCWDLRTMRPLWEKRVSPNVIYSVQHMRIDTSALVVGGIDGVLRILEQNTGKFLSSYVTDEISTAAIPVTSRLRIVEKKRAKALPEDVNIDSIRVQMRPSITCVAVGMKKIVTTHNDKHIRMWKFKN